MSEFSEAKISAAAEAIQHLPPVQFADLDPKALLDSLVTAMETANRMAGIEEWQLFPGDPRRLFLDTLGYALLLERHGIDNAGRMNLLAHATEAFIDHIGAFWGERGKRLDATPAKCTCLFTLSAPQTSTVIIPLGTQVSPGNNVFFATDFLAFIPPGETEVEVSVTSLTPGAAGNGYLPGQISIIVNWNTPFASTVENTTETSGGADVESDDRYRYRLYLVPETLSTAGPTAAYEFWALSASPDIMAVGVYSPNPGEVKLVPLMKDGELPSTDVLDAVLASCNPKDRRPLTDMVIAAEPDIVPFDLEFTYWIDQSNVISAVTIQQQVDEAVQEWLLWQRSDLSRDIIPDKLIEMCIKAGARRLEIVSPAYTVLNDGEVAIVNTPIAVTFGGLES